MRAGMRTIGLAIRFGQAKEGARGLISVAKARAKRLINSCKTIARRVPNPPIPPPADESSSANGSCQCEPGLAGGAGVGIVRNAARRLQQPRHLAAKPRIPGYALPTSGPKTEAAAAPAGAPEVPLPALLAKADAKKGEQYAKVCQTCHNFEKGAGPKIGPPLYGVVGRPVASVPGFAYSDSLKAVGGDWTYEKINKMITDPKSEAPGTKMTFPGRKRPAEAGRHPGLSPDAFGLARPFPEVRVAAARRALTPHGMRLRASR